MSTISFDGQSLLIDGKRTWMISGAIHYPRVPRALWADRLRAAKQAGLNCIETYVFWNLHEPRPGVFDFQGQNDLRAFVQLVGQMGLYCIVRPGPYVCAEWDAGGFPSWLHRVEGASQLRYANPAFLEACARYYGAVMEQIRDLQVTAPHRSSAAAGVVGNVGGPIVLMQVENEWFCHNPAQEESYLRELVRYLREEGCTVPIVNCNNLWQRIEGTIDCWNGSSQLTQNLWQLRAVQPNAPRLVTEYWPGWFDEWGQPHNTNVSASKHLHRMAQILAAGAMTNIYMFHGGTNFGFTGGRTVARPGCFMTTSYDYDAPLSEAGGRGPKYDTTKRISVFQNQFGNVLANLSNAAPRAAIVPTETSADVSVIHHPGSQGDLLVILRGEENKSEEITLLLPTGEPMTVPIGEQRAMWLLLNANLAGVAVLNQSNLQPWALIDKKLLVMFGPAGAQGSITINHSPLRVTVPEGHEPVLEQHEDLTVVVLNVEQLDATYLVPGGIVVGAGGLDEKDQPIARAGWAKMTLVRSNGSKQTIAAKPGKTPATPALKEWQVAEVTEYLDGTAPSFAPIAGPMSHEQLKNDWGYGWYRITLKADVKGSCAMVPGSGHRLHLFRSGKPAGLLGLGPGAMWEPGAMHLGKQTVVLTDNLGRFNYGWKVGERTGLFGDFLQVAPIKLGKPQIVSVPGWPDPFAMRGYWPMLRVGESHPTQAAVWKFKVSASQLPLTLDIGDLPARVMIVVNDKPVDLYDPDQCSHFHRRLITAEDGAKTGVNDLKFIQMGSTDGKIDWNNFVTLYACEANLTGKAEWAFSPWAAPGDEKFTKLSKSNGNGQTPRWYRCTFNVTEARVPLWFEALGLSKGQLYLNGQNVGRYFVSTANGKPVPPQSLYYLPEPWLKTDGPNTLMVFDEHGKSPIRSRLVYNAQGPYRKD